MRRTGWIAVLTASAVCALAAPAAQADTADPDYTGTAGVSDYGGYSVKTTSWLQSDAVSAYYYWKSWTPSVTFRCGDASTIQYRTAAKIVGGAAVTVISSCTIYFDQTWWNTWKYAHNGGYDASYRERKKEQFCTIMHHELGHEFYAMGHHDGIYGTDGPLMTYSTKKFWTGDGTTGTPVMSLARCRSFWTATN